MRLGLVMCIIMLILAGCTSDEQPLTNDASGEEQTTQHETDTNKVESDPAPGLKRTDSSLFAYVRPESQIDYEQATYEIVLSSYACCLRYELDRYEHGDKTTISQGNLNLNPATTFEFELEPHADHDRQSLQIKMKGVSFSIPLTSRDIYTTFTASPTQEIDIDMPITLAIIICDQAPHRPPLQAFTDPDTLTDTISDHANIQILTITFTCNREVR